MQGELDKSTVTVEDFYSRLSIIDRTSKQKINRDIGDLINTTKQLDLTDIYRPLHLTAKYAFFSIAHRRPQYAIF